MSKPKRWLEMMNQMGLQSNTMEGDRLVDAAATSAFIIANMVKEEVTAESVKTVQDTFASTYYNKYNNKDQLYAEDFHPEDVTEFVDDATIYVDIAKDQPNLKEVVIGGAAFKNKGNYDYNDPENRYKKISIGKNAFLNINIWKVVDGVLKIAVPYLVCLTDYETGVCKVIAGGLPYEVEVSEPVTSALKIKSARMTKVTEEYPATVALKGNVLDVTLTHAAQGLAMVIGNDTEDILDTATTMYTLRDNMSLALMTPANVEGSVASYLKYMVPWENAPVKKESKTSVHSVVIVPEKGLFDFTVNAHAYVM